MISQAKLDEICTKAIAEGKNAHSISGATGIPLERVQATMHRLRGADSAKATKGTKKRRRQRWKQAFGTGYVSEPPRG